MRRISVKWDIEATKYFTRVRNLPHAWANVSYGSEH
jgi:hypothetical protein